MATSPEDPVTSSRVVRSVLGVATFLMLGVAVLVGDARVYAAAAVFGTVWWLWDLLVDYVFEPLGEWATQHVLGGGLGGADSDLRPDLDELIRLLETHLRHGASRQVDLNAAIRLEEIYRLVKKDPERARRVIELVRSRYPDAPELERYGREEDEP